MEHAQTGPTSQLEDYPTLSNFTKSENGVYNFKYPSLEHSNSQTAKLAQAPIDKLVDLMSLYNFANYGSHQIGLD
jgi:hypothetical protein